MTKGIENTSTMDGRRLRGDRSRLAILAEAVRLASEEGLEGLTFGRIGNAVGVSKGNIQALFGSREQLQLATLDEAMSIYRRSVVEPALAEQTPRAQAIALLENWYHFVRSRKLPGGCFLNAVSSEFRCRTGPIRERIESYRQAKRTRFRKLVEQLREAGELHEDSDPDELVFRWVACEAAANVAALMGDTEEFERSHAFALAPLATGH